MSALAPEIFKAYDIRGLYGPDIDGDAAELIGRAFARVIADIEDKPASELRLGLGRDMRLSAPELASRYRDGMSMEGAQPAATAVRTPFRWASTMSSGMAQAPP